MNNYDNLTPGQQVIVRPAGHRTGKIVCRENGPLTRYWVRIDGPKCPACDHRELDVTFEPIYGYGLPDGCSDIVRRECPACPWIEEGAGE